MSENTMIAADGNETDAPSVKSVLLSAADLLEQPGAWTQNMLSATKRGYAIGAMEDNAACWCAMGAIFREARGAGDLTRPAYDALADVIGHGHIPSWNDAPERTQAEVVAALRAAAEGVGDDRR